MKLYLFRPSKKWNYCGGCLAILAESLEACQEQIGEYEKLYYSESDIPEDSDSFHIWAQVESFEVQGEMPRMVLNDYNWG